MRRGDLCETFMATFKGKGEFGKGDQLLLIEGGLTGQIPFRFGEKAILFKKKAQGHGQGDKRGQSDFPRASKREKCYRLKNVEVKSR